MPNCTFGFPLYSDQSVTYAPALSGGSWSTSLPLTNVQTRSLQQVARSTSAAAASTKIIVDLGVARAVGVLAVLIPNLTKSSTPTIQWKGGTTSGGTDVYNPGTQQAWPTGLTAEDVTRPDGSELHVWSVTVPTTTQTARYWELDIVDTANADGYLNVARLVIAGLVRPSVNMNDHDKQGLEIDTVRIPTDGSAVLYRPKPDRRTAQFTIENLTAAESLATIRTMQRRLGTSGQVFWVPDPADATYAFERNFLATLRELGPLESNSLRYGTTFSLIEEL